MKFLLVHNAYQHPGGEDTVVQAEKHLLTTAGHEVVVYRRHNDDMLDYSILRKIALIQHTVWASDSYRAVLDILQREKPDVAHFHNTLPLISPTVTMSP